jgi:hypothetical protein
VSGTGRYRPTGTVALELWNTLPPREDWRDKIAFNRSLGYAKTRRWLLPLAWDDIEPPIASDAGGIDEMAVELTFLGEHVRLSIVERRAAVIRLYAERWSNRRIAETLRITARTVLRIRQELGLEAFDFADLRPVGAA